MTHHNGSVVTAEAAPPVEPQPVEQLKALMAHYAAERDKHFAASEQHKVAAHQFAGAYDAAVQMLSILEKASGETVPD